MSRFPEMPAVDWVHSLTRFHISSTDTFSLFSYWHSMFRGGIVVTLCCVHCDGQMPPYPCAGCLATFVSHLKHCGLSTKICSRKLLATWKVLVLDWFSVIGHSEHSDISWLGSSVLVVRNLQLQHDTLKPQSAKTSSLPVAPAPEI